MHIAELNDTNVGSTVTVRGWVHRHRASKTIVFIIVRDATGIVQCTLPATHAQYADAENLPIESSVDITGMLKKDERAPGGYEIETAQLRVVHRSEDVFPITKDQSAEFLLDKRHLWIRSRRHTMIFRIKAVALSAAREWLDKNGFIETTPPIIVSGQTEGGSTLFDLKYFDTTAYLSQSAQLYQEALIFGLERVYAITPSFRAEKSRTTRHLTEYWHLEQTVASRTKAELEFLGRDPQDLRHIKPPFKHLSYAEAVTCLQNNGFDVHWGSDFGTKEEAFLTQKEKKPGFIELYPLAIKAFYMKENPDDPRTVLCSDLLAPEGFGEMIGGSERETDYAKITERLKAQGENLSSYEWYLDLRRYGSVPHSGFGMGIERLVRWLCKLEHIRDALPFPRTINRSYP